MHQDHDDRRRETSACEPVREIEHCTGSSLTGAGHGHPHSEPHMFHDYMAWYRSKFLSNRHC